MIRLVSILLCCLALAPAPPGDSSGFTRAIALARNELEKGNLEAAVANIDSALERDANSVVAWELRTRWAEAAGNRDELVYSLHRTLQLQVAQGLDKSSIGRTRARVLEVDPHAAELFSIKQASIAKLRPLAEKYEKDGRPHSAIRVHKEILALDSENVESKAAIERIASTPDPTLAGDAKPRDLLEGVSEQWIAQFDAEHAEWKDRAKLERDNYTTYTDAGYAVLLRSAEAMEQMNAFYRVFFRYGTKEDGRNPSPINLHIFKNRDEYLKLGIGPPAEWTGGHFTGDAVETYITEGGFEGMVGTLFHEAAHQFVSLATSAAGWLNEGLASFFEGCRILANGTVIMNLPASGRLFPLASRMEKGWMVDSTDGIDPEDPTKSNPPKAPTFRIVLENRYEWGPPWYAPTWGVVYFLYNFQDPVDGRFVYRRAFQEFIDKSGGRMGEGAVENFEEVVLANPMPPTKGVASSLDLPRNVDQLNEVWKDWIIALRDEQSGRAKVERPYRDWALNAVTRGDVADAIEHFEKGLIEARDDPEIRIDFAELLIDQKQEDRAAKLLNEAARIVESTEPVDEARLALIDRRLRKVDPSHQTLGRVRADLEEEVTKLVRAYLDDGLELMAMEASWRMGTDFSMPGLFELFEEAVRKEGHSLARWKLAYNEENLDGWAAAGQSLFEPDGPTLRSQLGQYREGDFTYQFLTLDEVTSGDFSLEAEVHVVHGEGVFAGLVFGRKSSDDFHGLILYPPEPGENGYVDLTSFYGGGKYDTWRHNPVHDEQAAGESRSERWYRLRIDVTGNLVDVWIDGAYVTTHEFASVDVLRGSFGLITGPGKARFRNIRYLARQAGDPASAIERELKMEASGGEGVSRDGSWLGQVPPFPTVDSWLQEPRETWQEAGSVPQLLVLWSIDQNDKVRIDEWLQYLAEELAPMGVRFVCVAAGYDAERLPEYLETHSFPGSLAIDKLGEGFGVGLTHEAFGVEQFFLPRLVLLDVDQTVAWEGDPGFPADQEWDRSMESFLRAPLDELLHKRQLREVQDWSQRWKSTGAPALASGDFAGALPLLTEAKSFDAKFYPLVAEAQRRLASVQRALDEVEETAAELTELEAEPALPVLIDWGKALDVRVDTRKNKTVKSALKSGHASAWERASGMLAPLRRKAQAGKDPGSTADVVARMEALGGLFPTRLREALSAADGDPAAVTELVLDAESMPGRWLAAEFFGWSAD